MNTRTKQITAGESFTLHHGDNLATLKAYPDNTFDSVVCDPPYLIDFLNKGWDSSEGNFTPLFKECLRVLKPGGHLLAFSAARTYHKLATMVENAGFEIRDQLQWCYVSGFPKSQSIGKQMLKKGDYYLAPNCPAHIKSQIQKLVGVLE
jgi:site-specific DNA-methyltransferase (adenine-specific)